VSAPDPKDAARRKFAAGPQPHTTVLDLIESQATDPPMVVRGLVEALRPAAQGDARIAELGFGSGWLLDALADAYPACRLHGLDMSPAMAGAAAAATHGGPHGGPQAGRIMVGDIERLPFRDAAFDAITTNWTLYFMRDIDAALDGIRRCLRSGGVFVAATVAPDNMIEFEEMSQAAQREALARDPTPDIGARFDLANGGDYVRRHFDAVEVLEWTGELVLTSPEQALLLWPNYGPQLAGDDDTRARAAFERIARDRFARDGAIRMRRHSGAFAGRR
jgi:SAM-dependent methyltransferase